MNLLHRIQALSFQGLAVHSINIERGSAVEDGLHVLDSRSPGLLDEQVAQCRHGQVEERVEDERVAAPGPDHVRSHEREHEVEQPLRRDGHGSADFADASWENLQLGISTGFSMHRRGGWSHLSSVRPWQWAPTELVN